MPDRLVYAIGGCVWATFAWAFISWWRRGSPPGSLDDAEDWR